MIRIFEGAWVWSLVVVRMTIELNYRTTPHSNLTYQINLPLKYHLNKILYQNNFYLGMVYIKYMVLNKGDQYLIIILKVDRFFCPFSLLNQMSLPGAIPCFALGAQITPTPFILSFRYFSNFSLSRGL